MKPTQSSGPVESRVWYAHDLVVPDKRESKVRESAVAAAARQALESTNSMPRRAPRPRRTPWFVGLGLAGATAALLFVPWWSDSSDSPLPATGEPSRVGIAAVQEEVPTTVDAPQKDTAEPNATIEKEIAENTPADRDLVTASPATDRAPPETGSVGQPRVAGFTATKDNLVGAGSAGDVSAIQLPIAVARPDSDAGEIAPSQAAPEIDVVEIDQSQKSAGDTETSSTAASQPRQRRVPVRANKQQTVEVYETGDCAMPSWAWRVFGFTEPVKRKRAC